MSSGSTGTRSASPWREADIDAVGTISFVPVPEPAAYAMLVAGLGLMGFIGAPQTALHDHIRAGRPYGPRERDIVCTDAPVMALVICADILRMGRGRPSAITRGGAALVNNTPGRRAVAERQRTQQRL